MRIIDTHQHLWDLAQFPYGWCRQFPALNRSYYLKDYIEAAAGSGIDQTVFVEADVDDPNQLAEARDVQALADSALLIGGIVANCRPERECFAAQVEALKKLPKVKGVRRVLHTVPDEVSQSPLFADNVRSLAQYGLSFDLCVLSRQLPLALDLVRRCPEVTFILDHCGVPDIKGRAFDPWRAQIAELALHPKVNCKISGLVAYTGTDSWTEADLQPWVEHVIEHFGWERIMWGSDWPVCTLTSSLGRWLQAARSLVRQASAEQQSALFCRNAERIYRLDSAGASSSSRPSIRIR